MKSFIYLTVLSTLLLSSCKKDEKKPRQIECSYTLSSQNHFEVTIKKNDEIMFGYSDEKYTAYPQGDGTFKMGSPSFEAKKGDNITVYVVDNYLSEQPVYFTMKVNGSTVSINDNNPVASAINVSYTVE